MASHHKKIVLASKSGTKISLMQQLGIPFDTLDVDVDETIVDEEAPEVAAKRLAAKKAKAAFERLNSKDDCFDGTYYILGADQVITTLNEGKWRYFRKPNSPERAVEQLLELQGRAHELYCAVAIYVCNAADGTQLMDLDGVHFRMQMRSLSVEEIRNYVAEESPLHCAGSYMIEKRGIGLFEWMDGRDFTGIIGLPLTRVRYLLDKFSYFDDTFW